MDVSMSRCGLPTGLVWLSEKKQSPNKLFQGDTLSPNKVKRSDIPLFIIGNKTDNERMMVREEVEVLVRDRWGPCTWSALL